MALLKFFKPVKKKPDLPDPDGPLSSAVPSSAISSANTKVLEALTNIEENKKRTRGPYLGLAITSAQKYEIGKRAAEYGVTNTIRYYSKKYPDLSLKETSVRRMKNAYQDHIKKQLASGSSCSKVVEELPNKKIGRPLMTGEEIDVQVQRYLLDLRGRGCVVNTHIAIAVGEGILSNKDPSCLAVNGGGIQLTKDWAKYLFRRMGLVKRKVTTKAKVNVERFEELKKGFLQDIRNIVVMDEIPNGLIINLDQTGLNYVPVSQWTMEAEGAKRVQVDGKDDKRQITAVFACTMAGDFLFPQLVYQGKTTRCLPKFQFPSGWSITCSENHWCNEETMKLYITDVILPYLHQARQKLGLSPTHRALLIFDNFKGQCTEVLLKLLDAKNINVILIPANCTDRLQPLDLSINKAAKEFLRNQFQQWYASQVCLQLEGKAEMEPIDLRMSIIKPLGAKWLVSLYDYLKSKPSMIINGFIEAGIIDCVTCD